MTKREAAGALDFLRPDVHVGKTGDVHNAVRDGTNEESDVGIYEAGEEES